MALPVTIPNEFANATASIPLSQLDTNFNTLANAVNGISDGSESLANVSITGGSLDNVSLSNVTVSGETLDNVTLTNVTITSGNASVTNLIATTANATTANITTGNITTVNATTLDATNVEVTNIKAKDGTTAIAIADSTGITTQSTPAVISVDSTDPALRITQVGTGNALLVEDAANPDSTPVVVDASGNVVLGNTSRRANFIDGTRGGKLTLESQGTTGAAVDDSAISQIVNSSTSTASPIYRFGRSKNNALGSTTIVASGDHLGQIQFFGADGTNLIQAASIRSEVDGTPGTNDMPGRLVFSTTADGASSPTERMRIDSSGNVGIGTSSPVGKLDVYSASTGSIYARGGSVQTYLFGSSGGGIGAAGTGSNHPFGIYTNATERMRIDTSGNLLVGTTSAIAAGGAPHISVVSGANAALRLQRTTDGGIAVFYHSAGTAVGNISVTSSATAYNTSSDYRLKENIAPMTGALAKVLELNPVTYTWKVDGSAGEGFIAHELQAICPEAVTGEKDATEIQQVEVSPSVPATYDDEGNELTPAVEAVYEEREVPVYQGVDTSFLVATLTAAIQELKAELDTVKAELATLKG